MAKGNKPFTIEIKDGETTIYKRKLGRSGKYDSIIQLIEAPIKEDKIKLSDGSVISGYSQETDLKRAIESVNAMKKAAEEYLLKNPAPRNENKPPEKLSPRRRAMSIRVYAETVKKYLNDSTHFYAMKAAMELQMEYDYLFFSDWEEEALVGSQFYKRDLESKYKEQVKKEELEKLALALWEKDEFKNTTKRPGEYNIRKTAREIEEITGHGYEGIRKFLSELANK